MIRERHRGVSDPGREQLDKKGCDRPVNHRDVDDQNNQHENRSWEIYLRRVCNLWIARRSQSLSERLRLIPLHLFGPDRKAHASGSFRRLDGEGISTGVEIVLYLVEVRTFRGENND